LRRRVPAVFPNRGWKCRPVFAVPIVARFALASVGR
jgi:hypothetical protein